ncbi:MAG: MBL fold metallo-hydrolase [Candidatus Sumerlaeota bacterium]
MERIANSPLSILPLGTSDAFCRTDYHTSAVLLAGRTVCLVDCPEPIHKILHERTAEAGLEISAADIQHVLLTHLHGDHANGLESFLFMRKFVYPDLDKPLIHCLPEVADVLWEGKLACSMADSSIPEIGMDIHLGPDDYYELHRIETEKPFMVGEIEIVARRAMHSVPTFGFRASCGGRTLGYSGDTIFDPEHIAFLSSADLIFHDCNDSPIHTEYESLVNVEPGVREKMAIFHMSDAFDREHSLIPAVEPGRLYAV